MDESQFHSLADPLLFAFLERIEEVDEEGDIDAELNQGVLTVTLPQGKSFVVSKHAPTRQIWLSSPLSGGLHFRYDGEAWRLPDGRELSSLFAAELRQITGQIFPLAEA